MDSFIGNVKSTIANYKMLRQGDHVIVGVSGGADSLCLLHVLNRLKDELGIKLFAAHLNHQFRGVDAEEDASFVEEICRQWNIPCRIESFDVPAYAKAMGLSPEEAGREIRYQLFERVKKEANANKIAVAQNQNDNVETVLMRLLRGTGLEGLKGIEPVRQDIIRPLLECSRESIECYCTAHQLTPRVDKTNLEPVYLRNKIRLELIPYLQTSFNPNINEAVIRLAQVAREENEYLEQQGEILFKKMAEIEAHSIKISKAALQEQHPAMQRRLLRKSLETLAETLNGFEYKHFQGMLQLLDKNTGAAMTLPYSIRAYISYDNLIIAKKIEKTDKKCYYKLKYNCDNAVFEAGIDVKLQLIEMKDLSTIPKSNCSVYLDAGKVKGELVLRNRGLGDIFSPIGLKGSKKLKDYLIDKKIPKEKRDDLLLLAEGNEIVWILGGVISEKYKLTADTQEVLMVSYHATSNNILFGEETTCEMI